jgi:TRAP-type C4-dicarboxylate transport system permease small subunit
MKNKSLINRIDDAWGSFEKYLLVSLVLGMILLAVLQIFLRNFFSTGIRGADIIIRHMVLWVGLVGASLAAKEERHLSIDIASRLIPKKWYGLVDALLCLVTFGVSLLLLWASITFNQSIYEYGGLSGIDKGLPSLLAGIILPLAFASIGLRFLLRSVRGFIAFAKGKTKQLPLDGRT